MNRLKLIARNLRYHGRMNLCIALGAALATAILVGALGTGDSVRSSLRAQRQDRVGRVDQALETGERTLRADAAALMAQRTARDVAPVYRASGAVDRLPITVLGIDRRFWTLGGRVPPPAMPGPDEALLNRRLADQLGVAAGDTILVHVEQPSRLPPELSFAAPGRATLGLRVTVRGIVDADRFGAFRLQHTSDPTYNVFLSRAWLVNELGVGDRANLLLAGRPAARGGAAMELDAALRSVWTADDASLRFANRGPNDGVELSSPRIFLDAAVAEAALAAVPGAQPVIGYFVSAIRVGQRAIPYSIASAPGASLLPLGLRSDQILLNAWAAQDLNAKIGDTVRLVYDVPGPLRRLVTRTNAFELAGIVPMSSPAADPTLAPELPGISDARTCADWDPGLPVELDRIRPQDEAYWETYRGTPKAFLSLAAAADLWRNRYGTYTAIRFDATNAAEVARRVMEPLNPAALGLRFEPVKALAAPAGGSVDFGQLFLALSLFILASALLLTGLLFAFGIESRAREIGILLSVGWEKRRVRSLLLWEGAGLALIGSSLGVALGMAYHRGVLTALASVWRGAVASTALEPALGRDTAGIGWAVGLLVSLGVMAFGLRRVTGREGLRLVREALPRGRRWPAVAVAVVCGGGAVAMGWGVDAGRGQQVAGLFFGVGSLLLIAFLAVFAAVLTPGRAGSPASSRTPLGKCGLLLRGCRLRRGRTLTGAALLAAGLFVVVAVSANRHAAVVDPERRSAGTGGFAFFMELAVPVVHDLNTARGRAAVGLPASGLSGLRFVPLRYVAGDDASCLNLDRVVYPRVLGVDPAELDRRGAFTFAALAPGIDAAHPWLALRQPTAAHALPAVADQTVITWSLNKELGDRIPLRTEAGGERQLELVGGLRPSMLQGYVVVSERLLRDALPGDAGARVFLVDAPVTRRAEVEQELRSVFRNHGLTLVAAEERLARFSVVQDTYLGMFLVLGGLGLLLGTGGVGIVLLRNVLERRRELGILRTLGFTRPELIRYVMAEHVLILLMGLLCGVPAALIAVLPSLTTAGRAIPWGQLATLVGLVILSALFWIGAATLLALRGSLLDAIREE